MEPDQVRMFTLSGDFEGIMLIGKMHDIVGTRVFLTDTFLVEVEPVDDTSARIILDVFSPFSKDNEYTVHVDEIRISWKPTKHILKIYDTTMKCMEEYGVTPKAIIDSRLDPDGDDHEFDIDSTVSYSKNTVH